MNAKLFIFLCCAIFLIGESSVHVDGDRFETLKLRHAESPDVCIFEADPAVDVDRIYNFEVLTRVSVDMWVDALEKQYPKGNWEIKVLDPIPFAEHDKALPSDYPECEIMITFDIFEDSERLGYTSIDFSRSGHKHMIVTVFTYQQDPDQKIMFTDEGYKIRQVIPHSLATIQSVISHELGHAFGLLHYDITTPLAEGESGNDRSLMYPSLDTRNIGAMEIKQPELIMIGEMYGTDGWGGYEYPLVVKQCSFISGLMYDCKW
tara:strand:- start:95 stop:880 length:786 start_codon:yes stop_codon:yes gene_type:complete